MAVMQNILGWLAFLCCAIIVQTYVPGLDALIVGIILVTQERDYKTMVWLLPATILLQEGMGSQYFGASILYVICFFFLYRISRALALASRAAFVILVSLGMGALRVFLGWFFATLQNTPYTMTGIVYDGLLEAVYILIAWVLLSRLRRVVVHEEKKTES